MRKQHQEMLHYIKNNFPIVDWIRNRRYWKHKCVCMDSCNIWVKYYDTYVLRYAMWTDILYLNFTDWETNSTACLMKDMVEWLFGWKRLPRWWWVIDKNWHHRMFKDDCTITVHTKDLCCYPEFPYVYETKNIRW